MRFKQINSHVKLQLLEILEIKSICRKNSSYFHPYAMTTFSETYCMNMNLHNQYDANK